MTDVLNFKELAIETLRAPLTAAQRLMALNLDTSTLWLALFLMAVLNTILFTLSNMVMPIDGQLPAALKSPVVYLMIVAGGLVLTAFALFWTGGALGGQGRLEDMLVLLVWLQSLRVLGQGITLVLMMISPGLAGLMILFIGLAGLWILINFIQAAHGFQTPWHAAGVLVAAMVALVLGLSVLLSLIGVSAMAQAYV
jgi:hypothetical protein